MWFNMIIRLKSYQFLFYKEFIFFITGTAWLSSARVVRCLVYSLNERNPYLLSIKIKKYHFLFILQKLLMYKWEEGGLRQVGMIFMNWATHVLQWKLQNEVRVQTQTNHQKFSQSGLLTAIRQYEVGIISNRKSGRYGEFVPGPCTHRPSRLGS